MRYADKRICVVNCLEEYVRRTNHLRTPSQLFVNFIKPYRPITEATIGKMDKENSFLKPKLISQCSKHIVKGQLLLLRIQLMYKQFGKNCGFNSGAYF